MPDALTDAKKYRKKPVVIEAYQAKEECIIHTLEGDMKANPGDWIITGINGERYPCKPDIFAKTYEPVGNSSTSDALTDRARMAATEIDELMHSCTALLCHMCGPDRPMPCRFGGEWPDAKRREHAIAAVITRNLAGLTLIELAELVEKRERWLQNKISAGRRLDCEGGILATAKATGLLRLKKSFMREASVLRNLLANLMKNRRAHVNPTSEREGEAGGEPVG